jgi:hypothetical protein
MAEFFAGAPVPVEPAESIEIMAFIQAAQMSKVRGGAPVPLAEAVADAEREATERLNRWLPASRD